jgi:plastocyanin
MRVRTLIRLFSGKSPTRLLAPAVSVLMPFASALAQGSVGGRVTLQEKPGQKTTDLDNAIVWLEPATPPTTRPQTTKVELVMRGRQFAPHVRVIQAGSTVAFPNQDAFSHNIFSTTPGSSFDLGLYGRGQAKTQVFSRTGAIPVYCNIHASMAAFVVVVPSPWYAQAGADGRWTITGVPEGSYTLRVWHERAPGKATPVHVGATMLDVPEIQLDARGYVVARHKDKLGQDYNAPGRIIRY